MRRCLQIFGLIVLALVAGGWGSIFAAAFCPHMNGQIAGAAMAERMSAALACCPEKIESSAKPSCHESAMEQEPSGDAKSAHLPANGAKSSAPFGLAEDACAHCMGRAELPASTIVARRNVELKRDVETATTQALRINTPPISFTRPVSYRQGAPPGSLRPKRLLIGLLLI